MNQEKNHWLSLYLSGQYPGNYRLPNRFDVILKIRQLDSTNFSDSMLGLLQDKGDVEFYNSLFSAFESLHSSEEYKTLLERLEIPEVVMGDPYKKEEKLSGKKIASKNIGVFMDFDDDRSHLYESVFRPAIESCGFTAGKVDELTNSGENLHEKIQEMIENYSMFIVDISGKGQNKFIELGAVLALKKDVIILKDKSSSRPFNIIGLKMIDYPSPSQNTDTTLENQKNLQEEIEKAISEF